MLQYAMGPWQRTHLHEFSFTKPRERGSQDPSFYFLNDDRLNIGLENDFEFIMPGMSPRPKVPNELEESKDLRLDKVLGPSGWLYNTIAPQG